MKERPNKMCKCLIIQEKGTTHNIIFNKVLSMHDISEQTFKILFLFATGYGF